MFRPSRAPFNNASEARLVPLLSPPETELEPGPSAPAHEAHAASESHGLVEHPAHKFRRMAYNTSGPLTRDSRTPQRQSKWLIMVVPPTSLTHEPPSLGHTLSSGPTGRFSNGILMPLFPTLYGQLTAIAREFNIPSTTGLCVYLHIQESALPTVTPRISDETWQILWAHYFPQDDRPTAHTSHSLPIVGRIEFDIDLRRARWFSAWMGTGVRDRVDSEYMSRDQSIAPSHWRGESRTSFLFPDPAGEESPSPPEVTPTANGPFSRPIPQRQGPRPLLLERREVTSSRPSRHVSRGQNVSLESQSLPAPAVPPESTFMPNTLSPMVQESEEPQTDKKSDLDSIVRQWRASSVTGVPTTGAVAAGQPSLDPINMPPGADIELDLNDFAWSISSAGPPSDSPLSPEWPSPLPSIHIVERAAGSVCLTPTTCTSWGPPSSPSSPVSSVSRQPSVDLAYRMVEDAPVTPSTATTWGPEDLPTPISTLYRVPSVDIGRRNMGSVPPTPLTATTWGPADSPLMMPESPIHIRTPDAGERVFPDFEVEFDQAVTSTLGFPYYDAWTIEPWRHVWPYQAEIPSRNHEEDVEPWGHVWPYQAQFLSQYFEGNIEPWRHVWPYQSGALPRNREEDALLWRHVWPYQSVVLPRNHDEDTLLWRHVWPYQAGFFSHRRHEKDIDQAITSASTQSAQVPIGVKLAFGYPFIEIYPAVYPHDLLSIYTWAGEVSEVNYRDVQVSLRKEYPILDIYPVVYPYNLAVIYPSQAALSLAMGVEGADPTVEPAATVKAQPVVFYNTVYEYPYLIIYPPVYPYNVCMGNIYPRRVSSTDYLVETASKSLNDESYLQTSGALTYNNLLPVVLTEVYPSLTIYSPVYPFNLLEVYPSFEEKESGWNKSLLPVSLSTVYPDLVIYPSVYPYNVYEIYESMHGFSHQASGSAIIRAEHLQHSFGTTAASPTREVHVKLEPNYPYIQLYEPVYPWLVVYPCIAIPDEIGLSHEVLSSRYPTIQIYEPIHSHFNIYPSVQSFMSKNHADPSTRLKAYYPVLDLYTQVPISEETAPSRELFPSLYPTIQIYEPIYPHLIIYPPVQLCGSENDVEFLTRLKAAYPALEIYESVYPHLVVYPEVTVSSSKHKHSNYRKRAPTPGPGRQRLSPTLVTADSVSERRPSRSTVKRPVLPPLPSRHRTSSPNVDSTHSLARLKDESAQPRRSRRPKRTHLDLHLMVFGIQADPDSATVSTSILGPPRRKRPLKTHHELHLMVFAATEERTSDVVFQKPLSAVFPQRHRSGTVTQRGNGVTIEPTVILPEQLPSIFPSMAKRSSPSSTVNNSSSSPSTEGNNPTIIRSVAISSNTSPISSDSLRARGLPSSPSQTRKSVIGLPSSPAQTRLSSIGLPSSSSPHLTRVRSMNSREQTLSATGPSEGIRGLDRSKSMTEASRVDRRSTVQDRARIFARDSAAKNDSEQKGQTSTRPVIHRLDRSKIPFS